MIPQVIRDFCVQIYSFLTSLLTPRLSVSFPRSQLRIAIVGRRDQSIGEGAFSTVYQATSDQSKPARQYALKRMLLQSSDLANMARNEVDAYKRFKHPHIVQLVDYVERVESTKAVMYLLFPFYSRGSLREELNRVISGIKRKPSLNKVLRDFVHICQAVQVLHSHQPSYVHFDIKPDNILIDDKGVPLLTDLGSVRRAERTICDRRDVLNLADEAAEFCTASYRSPELYDPIKDMQIDCRTDVWALGCLLFAWWFGHSPFECEFIYDSNRVRLVECTALRILSNVPQPYTYRSSHEDRFIYDLVDSILQKSLTLRMFVPEIIEKIAQHDDDVRNSNNMAVDV